MPPAILVAPDSFKGSLTASEASAVITRAVRSVAPDARIIQIPIADGGEGTVETLVSATLGYYLESDATNAYGGIDVVPWGIIGGSNTAVMEIASCAGLPRTPLSKRDPKLTTSFGLGELILEAAGEDCSEFIIGLGGSATNDAGAGMAQALGVRLLDRKGVDLPRGGAALIRLHSIDLSGRDMRLLFKKCIGACDVDSPLLGEKGATSMFARQKGASDEDILLLEDALSHFAEIVKRDLGKDIAMIPGAGAAGGLGAGLMAFLNAQLASGIDFILDRLDFEAKCGASDLVITGEGKIDAQTKQGKAVAGVARRAAAAGKPVVAFAGMCDEKNRKLCKDIGLRSMHCITPEDMTEDIAMKSAARLLEARIRDVLPDLLAKIDM